MSSALNRRQFLRGDIARRRTGLRPPWAIAAEQFFEHCTRCHDCLKACPSGILMRGDGGFPTINFLSGECAFCRACVDVCPTGALDRAATEPWSLVVTIDQTCLAMRGVVCQACGDLCAARALRFPPRLGGIAVPVIEASTCTGCGACVAPCPSQSISLNEVA